MPKAKKTKKDEKWMGFYSGRIPKKLIPKPKRVIVKKNIIYACHYCSNKSDEGSGDFRPDVGTGGAWVCSPCIEKHVEPRKQCFVPTSTIVDNTDDDDDDVFQKLSPLEIMEKHERDKGKNFWLVIFGVIIIAIILSLVERSRIFSVVAVVALVAVYLLYKYEVKIK